MCIFTQLLPGQVLRSLIVEIILTPRFPGFPDPVCNSLQPNNNIANAYNATHIGTSYIRYIVSNCRWRVWSLR